MVPQHELTRRLASFQENLCKNEIDAALIVQHADLFYFCGAINKAYLYIPASGKSVLFVFPGAERVREETEFSNIVDLAGISHLPALLGQLGYALPRVLGLEADVVPASLHNRFALLFPASRIIDLSGLIRQIRMVKSPWEIEQIQSACKMGLEIFEYVPGILRCQMSELELAGHIEKYSRQLGHPGYMRTRGFNQELTYALVLSGPESAIPSYGSGPLGGRGLPPAFPHGSTQRRIDADEPVIVDYCAWAGGYVADMTRTYCLGKLSSHMQHAYDTALAIQVLLKERARSGAICSELWTAVRQLVRTNGLCEHFMGMSRRVPFIGHGVGVEIDELPVIGPRYDTVLEPNMVIAVEPKFVFPDGAIGLENTFVVGNQGLIPLVSSDDAVYTVNKH